MSLPIFKLKFQIQMTCFSFVCFSKFFKIPSSVLYFSIFDVSRAKFLWFENFRGDILWDFFSKLKLFRKMKRSLGEMLEARK